MAATVYKIPLTNTPQRFETTIGGRSVILKSRWFDAMQMWVLSILDSDTEEVLLNDMPMVTGADLLAQFRYLGIPGSLYVVGAGDDDAPASLDNLGETVDLYHIIDPDATDDSRAFQGYIPFVPHGPGDDLSEPFASPSWYE